GTGLLVDGGSYFPSSVDLRLPSSTGELLLGLFSAFGGLGQAKLSGTNRVQPARGLLGGLVLQGLIQGGLCLLQGTCTSFSTFSRLALSRCGALHFCERLGEGVGGGLSGLFGPGQLLDSALGFWSTLDGKAYQDFPVKTV